jgi:hypothetical protein
MPHVRPPKGFDRHLIYSDEHSKGAVSGGRPLFPLRGEEEGGNGGLAARSADKLSSALHFVLRWPMLKVGKCLVADAVQVEPLSTLQIPCEQGKEQGIFRF